MIRLLPFAKTIAVILALLLVEPVNVVVPPNTVKLPVTFIPTVVAETVELAAVDVPLMLTVPLVDRFPPNTNPVDSDLEDIPANVTLPVMHEVPERLKPVPPDVFVLPEIVSVVPPVALTIEPTICTPAPVVALPIKLNVPFVVRLLFIKIMPLLPVADPVNVAAPVPTSNTSLPLI